MNVTNIDADESLPKTAKLDKEAGTIRLVISVVNQVHFTLSRNLYILYVKCH